MVHVFRHGSGATHRSSGRRIVHSVPTHDRRASEHQHLLQRQRQHLDRRQSYPLQQTNTISTTALHASCAMKAQHQRHWVRLQRATRASTAHHSPAQTSPTTSRHPSSANHIAALAVYRIDRLRSRRKAGSLPDLVYRCTGHEIQPSNRRKERRHARKERHQINNQGVQQARLNKEPKKLGNEPTCAHRHHWHCRSRILQGAHRQ